MSLTTRFHEVLNVEKQLQDAASVINTIKKQIISVHFTCHLRYSNYYVAYSDAQLMKSISIDA